MVRIGTRDKTNWIKVGYGLFDFQIESIAESFDVKERSKCKVAMELNFDVGAESLTSLTQAPAVGTMLKMNVDALSLGAYREAKNGSWRGAITSSSRENTQRDSV